MDWIAIIRECFLRNAVLYTSHSRNEMQREEFGEIVEREVVEAVMAGEIIEEYPDDTPYQSVLMFGKTHSNRPIHMVCAYAPDEKLVIVITVFIPIRDDGMITGDGYNEMCDLSWERNPVPGCSRSVEYWK